MPDYNIESIKVPIKYLALEGGGVKGAAYPEALDELDKEHYLDDLECVAGSSAGGITAFLVAMGKSPTEIKEILASIDFKELNDNDEPFWTEAMGLSNHTIDGSILGSIEKAIRATTSLNDDGERAFGMYKGNTLMEIVEGILAEELGTPDATFADLEKARQIDPTKKGLILTGSNLTKKRLEYFGMGQDPNTSNMRIADAVRITMSFPGAFEAVRRNGDIYVDGGLANNFPFEPFDKEEFLPDGVSFTKDGTNPATLGLGLTSMKDDEEEEAEPEMGIMAYISGAFKAMRSDKEKLKNHEGQYIKIPDMGVKTLQFDLGDKELEALALSAKTEVEKWKRQRADGVVTQSLTPEKLLKMNTSQISVLRHVCEENGNNSVVRFIDSQMGHLKDSAIYTRAVDEYLYQISLKKRSIEHDNSLKERLYDADTEVKFDLLNSEISSRIEEIEQKSSSMEIMLDLLHAESSIYESLISTMENEAEENQENTNDILNRLRADASTLDQSGLSSYVEDTLVPLIDEKMPDHVDRENLIAGYTTILRNFFDGTKMPEASELKDYFTDLKDNHKEKIRGVTTEIKDHKDDIAALKELKRKYDAAKHHGEKYRSLVNIIHHYKKVKRASQNLWTKMVNLTKPFKPVFWVLDSLTSLVSSTYRKYKDVSNKLSMSLDKISSLKDDMNLHQITAQGSEVSDIAIDISFSEGTDVSATAPALLKSSPKAVDELDTVEELAQSIISSTKDSLKFTTRKSHSAPASRTVSAPASRRTNRNDPLV